MMLTQFKQCFSLYSNQTEIEKFKCQMPRCEKRSLENVTGGKASSAMIPANNYTNWKCATKIKISSDA